MESEVLLHGRPVEIGIAVPAEVRAGVVHADISAEKAGAALPGLPFAGGDREADTKGIFYLFLVHTPGDVDAELREPGVFQAGHDLHAVRFGDRHEGFTERILFRSIDFPHFREVLFRFLEQIDETHDDLSRVPLQLRGHRFEGPEVVLHRIAVREEDGVISPHDMVLPHRAGQFLKRLQDRMLVRHVRFDVFAVGRDSHMPELPVRVQFMEPRQHRRRVLRPEDQQVDDVRVEPVPGDRVEVVGVSYQDFPRFDPIVKPFGIECRDVGPVTGIDDHGSFLILWRLTPERHTG